MASHSAECARGFPLKNIEFQVLPYCDLSPGESACFPAPHSTKANSKSKANAEANSLMIIHQMYSGALNFIRQQQMAVLSTRDAEGHRWASVVFGPKGFLKPSATDCYCENSVGSRRSGRQDRRHQPLRRIQDQPLAGTRPARAPESTVISYSPYNPAP
jgi:hypothetical protein